MRLLTSDPEATRCPGAHFAHVYGLPLNSVEVTQDAIIVTISPKLWDLKAWIAPTTWGERHIEYRKEEEP